MIHHSCKKIQTFILISYTHGREILHCEVKVVSTCPNHLSSCQSSLQQESGSMVTHLSTITIRYTMYYVLSPRSSFHKCTCMYGTVRFDSMGDNLVLSECTFLICYSPVLIPYKTGMSRLHSYCQVLIPYIIGIHYYCQVLIPYIIGMSRLHSYCQVLIPCQ